MLDINLDYYLLEDDNKHQSPILIKDQSVDPNGPILQIIQEIKNDTIYLIFGSPYPKEPEICEYRRL